MNGNPINKRRFQRKSIEARIEPPGEVESVEPTVTVAEIPLDSIPYTVEANRLVFAEPEPRPISRESLKQWREVWAEKRRQDAAKKYTDGAAYIDLFESLIATIDLLDAQLNSVALPPGQVGIVTDGSADSE